MPTLISKRGLAKRAATYVQQTPAEILYLACRDDPAVFISSFIKIHHPIRGAVQLALHNKQIEYIDCLRDNASTMSLFARQAGSTTTTLAFILWEALEKCGHCTAVLSENHAMSTHSSQLVQYMIRELPEFLRTMVVCMNRNYIEFVNGSKILFDRASANALRGRTINRVFVDQVAHIQETEQHYLWAELLRLAFSGRSVNTVTTPRKKDDLFHLQWEVATTTPSAFKLFVCTLDDMTWSNIDKDQMRQQIGDEAFRREYMCEFV